MVEKLKFMFDKKQIKTLTTSRDLEDPFILKNDKGQESVVFSSEVFAQMVSKLEELKQQQLELELEKEIASQMPVDFDDVWKVAITQLEEDQKKNLDDELDVSFVVKKIRKSHPNLFIDMSEIARNIGMLDDRL